MDIMTRFSKVAGEKSAVIDSSRLYTDPLFAGLAAAGVGAGVRGLAGLVHTISRGMSENTRPKYPAPILTGVPYPVTTDEDDDNTKQPPVKTATVYSDGWHMPGYVPAIVGASLLGFKGGNMLADHLLNKRRKQEQEAELADAQSEFEKALLTSYNQPRQAVKLAADASVGEKLGAELDHLFNELQKQSADEQQSWLSRIATPAIGVYSLYALPIGALAASLMYNRVRKNSDQSVIDKAVKQRMRQAYETRPSEMFALPVPVPTDKETPDFSALAGGNDEPPATMPSFHNRRMIG